MTLLWDALAELVQDTLAGHAGLKETATERETRAPFLERIRATAGVHEVKVSYTPP